MRYRRRSVSYAGEPFSFEQVKGWESEEARVIWAVSHRGEFIGTMSTPKEITTRDFDMRSFEWLAQLLDGKRKPASGRGN